ncbi:MAG: hypothetical protein ACE10B_10030, partial [Phycisphaerales bacterium]
MRKSLALFQLFARSDPHHSDEAVAFVCSAGRDVRYGSETNINRAGFYIRFAPVNRHQNSECPLWGVNR